jgi:glycosidase
MAYSLIKDDHGLNETTALWRELGHWMRTRYPEAVLIPESDELRTVDAGVRGGFDADFALVIHPEHSALFNNGSAGVLPWQETTEPCYFDADADPVEGARALETFLDLWQRQVDTNGSDRLVVLPSADHDFSRLACGSRTMEQLPAAFTFLFTWGTIPSIYYGDEIGMRYLEGAPEKEGSIWTPKYNRAGCRTPMQWDNILSNAGFSTASAEDIYLPQDPDLGRPTVADQMDDPKSLLHFVRALVQLRQSIPALGTNGTRNVVSAGYPLAFIRNNTHLVVVNPLKRPTKTTIELPAGSDPRNLFGSGVRLEGQTIQASGFAHGIFELAPADMGVERHD